jgi:hypothetical protein
MPVDRHRAVRLALVSAFLLTTQPIVWFLVFPITKWMNLLKVNEGQSQKNREKTETAFLTLCSFWDSNHS